MNGQIIVVENLGKTYRLGSGAHGYGSLREVITNKFRALGKTCLYSKPFARYSNSGNHGNRSRDFHALRDVSFEVGRGESVGIIGRNGAGKSTLLKVLSRITPPTTGRFLLRGRPASLLEVGTGFHGELTGRENIYLNGAILGMSKAEIRRKFDEIVAFAEVERFLDTPVKRYSSGMYVRLAFAVAAHLEPEILLVDEVLSVGDIEFRQKCVGKMNDVLRDGRTILFVSHNMAAIRNLCSRVILLKDGRVAAMGAVDDVVSHYLSDRKRASSYPVAERTDRQGDGRVRIVGVRVNGRPSVIPATVCCGESLTFMLEYEVRGLIAAPSFAIGIWDEMGAQILYMNSRMSGLIIRSCHDTPNGGGQFPGEFFGISPPADGHVADSSAPRSCVCCFIPRLTLAPGNYTAHVSVWGDDAGIVDRLECAAVLNVEAGLFYRFTDAAILSFGKCLIDHTWDVVPPDECESGNRQWHQARWNHR